MTDPSRNYDDLSALYEKYLLARLRQHPPSDREAGEIVRKMGIATKLLDELQNSDTPLSGTFKSEPFIEAMEDIRQAVGWSNKLILELGILDVLDKHLDHILASMEKQGPHAIELQMLKYLKVQIQRPNGEHPFDASQRRRKLRAYARS